MEGMRAHVLIEGVQGTVEVAVFRERELATGVVFERQWPACAGAGKFGGHPPFLDGQVTWGRAEAQFVPVQITILCGNCGRDFQKPFGGDGAKEIAVGRRRTRNPHGDILWGVAQVHRRNRSRIPLAQAASSRVSRTLLAMHWTI